MLNLKIFGGVTFLTVGISMIFAISVSADITVPTQTVTLVQNKKPVAVVVLGKDATDAERYAANELVRYVKQITGAELPFVDSTELSGQKGVVVLVGLAKSNPLIATLVKAGTVDTSEEKIGSDGFIIKTAQLEGKKVLVLTGARGRSVLYAVYAFLEDHCGCGFFRDGERIPRQETLLVQNIDRVEKPHFAHRIGPGPGMECYDLWESYSVESWARLLDWHVKRRLNTVGPFNLGWALCQKLANARVGFPAEPIEKADLDDALRARAVFSLMDKRDLEKFARTFPTTDMTGEMATAKPGIKTFRFAGQQYNELRTQVHPADAFYGEWIGATIKTWTQLYGPIHVHYGCDPFPETHMPSVEKGREIVLSLAKYVTEAIRKVDPEGIWYCAATYAMGADYTPGVWDMETRRKFCEIAGDRMLNSYFVWNGPTGYADDCVNYPGVRTDYHLLLSMGGNDFMYGALEPILLNINDIIKRPAGKTIYSFSFGSETERYNVIWDDLMTYLAWNPVQVSTLDVFLEHYALRRYGAENLDAAMPFLKEMVRACYSGNDSDGPGRFGYQYHYRQKPVVHQEGEAHINRNRDEIEEVDGALQKGSLAAERLAGNKLFENDMVDLMREYIGCLGNVALQEIAKAFKVHDAERLNKLDRTLFELLDALQVVLSSREEYRIEDMARLRAAVPGGPMLPMGLVGEKYPPRAPDVPTMEFANPLEEERWRVRDFFLTMVSLHQNLWDYATRDMYELVPGYFKPRLRTYVDYLKECLARGPESFDEVELARRYRQIELHWIREGYDPKVLPPYRGTMIEAVKETFNHLKTNKSVQELLKRE